MGDAVANNVLTSTTQVFRRLFASFDMEAPISSNSSPTSLEIDFHTNLSTDAAFPSPQRCCDECERKFHEIKWENIDNDCKFFVSVISRTILPSCPVCQGGLFSGYIACTPFKDHRRSNLQTSAQWEGTSIARLQPNPSTTLTAYWYDRNHEWK